MKETDEYFAGQIDGFKIWNVALSATEMSSLCMYIAGTDTDPVILNPDCVDDGETPEVADL